MEETVEATLAQISALRSPVVRSCHIGNNTANNWAWLALGGNTRMVQLDHSLYGVDDVCLPWIVLGHRGVVEASYDHRGEPQPAAVGRHANEVLGEVDRKYFAHLNYGIFAEHAGDDLMRSHCRLAGRLGARFGAFSVTFDAVEILASRELLAAVLRDFAREGKLNLLINRWVLLSRKGYATVLKLGGIERSGPDDVALFATDCRPLFRGSVAGLTERFFAGMAEVAERLATGCRPASLDYPWITTFFGYLLYTAREYHRDPTQRVFWHAGGSSSQYYIHRPEVRAELDRLRDELALHGYLPPGARIRVIPTFSCQLFATNRASLAVLESLLAVWRECLQQEATRHCAGLLGSTTDPLVVAGRLCAALPTSRTAELRRLVDAFNALDVHQLPIAHFPKHDLAHYNKYGMAQRELLGREILWPDGFRRMTWSEAELLVKTLAHLLADEAG